MSQTDVTRLLEAIGQGEVDAYDRLVPLIQKRLREMARSRMRVERADHTLQPTALVNEAYIRLVGSDAEWENRAHFFGAAAEAMRRVLIDHARKRSAEKRGADLERVTFQEMNVVSEEPEIDVLALDEALTALEAVDVRLGQVVRLRFFAGFNIDEVAEILGISTATVKRDWRYSRAWLFDHMSQDQ